MRKGFTLIELLVVIGVLGVLTSVAAGYSRRGEVVIALASDRAALASAFSRAKALAIQTYQFPPTAPVPCGFGVRVSNIEFIIFKDLPLPTGSGFAPCVNPPTAAPFYDPSNPNERFKKYSFDPRLVLDLCFRHTSFPLEYCYGFPPAGSTGSFAEFETLFIPPNPDVFFANASPGTPTLFSAESGLIDATFKFYRRSDLLAGNFTNVLGTVVVSASGQVSTN